MRKSGLWTQFGSIAPQVRAGLQASASQSAAPIGQEVLQQLLRAADAIYAPEPMRGSALRALSKAIDPAHVPALLAWLDSPLGRDIVKLEEAGAAETDPGVTLREGAVLLAAMPEERRAAFREMIVLSRAPEAITSISINTALAIQEGIASVTPGGPAPSRRELRAALEARRAQMLQAFASFSLAMFAKLYAPLSARQLGEYLAFLRSPAGQHFTEVGVRAVEQALLEAAVEFGRKVPGARQGST